MARRGLSLIEKKKKKGEKENEKEYATISSDDVQLPSKLHVALYYIVDK